MGEGLQAHNLVANLTIVTFKIWAYSPQHRQNW